MSFRWGSAVSHPVGWHACGSPWKAYPLHHWGDQTAMLLFTGEGNEIVLRFPAVCKASPVEGAHTPKIVLRLQL